MDRSKRLGFLTIAAGLMLLSVAGPAFGAQLTQKERLGKQLFFDTTLSTPDGMSCGTCHDPGAGFADPRTGFPVSEGVVKGRFGSRNAPTVAYSSFSPSLRFNPGMGPMGAGVYEGGQNWDGIAATLKDQARLPFLNPLEMNNPNTLAVVREVRSGKSAKLFRTVYGQHILNDINADHPEDVDAAYGCIADAIAAYESSGEVDRFSSRYDAYLRGEESLSAKEERGLAVFRGKGACDRCHPSRPSATGRPPMFTSRHHANTGVPKNPLNPYYSLPASLNPLGVDFLDLGTGVTVGDSFHYGRFKIPTLRNVAATAPYMHNGSMVDLKTVVQFYSTRDVRVPVWPAPEWSANIIRADRLGNLGLTDSEIDDVVAFMGTLTDR